MYVCVSAYKGTDAFTVCGALIPLINHPQHTTHHNVVPPDDFCLAKYSTFVFVLQVELVITIEEMVSCDEMLPLGISDAFQEVLRCCLQQDPDKRMTASVLLESPWFRMVGIRSVDDAVAILYKEFQESDNENDENDHGADDSSGC